MSKFTLITGPRRSGKTTKALDLARADGRPFGVLVATELCAANVRAIDPGIPVEVLRPKQGQVPFNLIVLLDIQTIDKARFLDGVGTGIDRGADFIMTVCFPDPEDDSRQWLYDAIAFFTGDNVRIDMPNPENERHACAGVEPGITVPI